MSKRTRKPRRRLNRHWRWIQVSRAYPIPGSLFQAIEDLIPSHCIQREQNRCPPRVYVASPVAGCTMRELMALAMELTEAGAGWDPFSDYHVRPECLRAILMTPQVELIGRMAMRKLK